MNDTPPSPYRPRLLVVDDQPINIQVLYRTFGADHQVFMATSGAQALQVAQQQLPDLILLDLELGDIDGFEVCLRLQQDKLTAGIPVIFVTSHSSEAAETRGLQVGAVDFISKPVNPAIVRARVRTHLTLKQQADQLRQYAFIDGLTGLHNRRALDERLEAELRHSMRSENALSVLLIDVDYFKKYNDLYGHLMGDEALRQVSAALKACMLRPVDLAARYGGEEFACLLPETPLEGAVLVAERLRQQVALLAIPHAASDVSPWLSISIGVAAKPGRPGMQAKELLALADEALYDAKRSGRDRVAAHAAST